MRASKVGWLLIAAGVALYVGCGSDDDGDDPAAPRAGAGGGGGSAGGAPGEAGNPSDVAGSGGSGESGSPGSDLGGQGGTSSDAGGAGGQMEPGEVVIASDQAGPTGIALDADFVYWANQDSGTIVSCPLTGCGADDPVELVTGQVGVRGIDVDDTSIYWIRDLEGDNLARVRKCPLAGCDGAPEVLVELGAYRANDVHVDGAVFYYGAWPLFGTCPTDGCLVSGQVPLLGGPIVSVDTDADYAYLASVGGRQILRCTLPDCSDAAAIVSDLVPFSVAIDDSGLYFAAYDYFEFDNADPHEIFRCPLEGCDLSAAELIQGGNITPYAIAVNDTRLFYTNVVPGTVISIPKSGL